MEKEIIILKINQLEKQIAELKELLGDSEAKTHNCNDHAVMFFDYKNGTSNAIKHKCGICGKEIIPMNFCTNPNPFLTYGSTFTNTGFSHYAGKPIN